MEAQGPLEDHVEWFLDHLRVERGASGHTILAYQGDLTIAARFFHGLEVSSWAGLQADHLLRYEATLGPPLARTTAMRRMSALRSLLRFLKRNGAGPETDLPSVGSFRKPQSLPKSLSKDDLQKLLEGPDVSKPQGLRDRAMMELIYGAGLRISEAVDLEREALDLEEATVRVAGKRGKVRRVPLPAGTVAWLSKYLEEARPTLAVRPTSRVLIADEGGPLLRQVAYARLRHFSQAAGLEGVSPHTLRHTYAVHMLKGGADLRVVQELLGHESVATTQIYTGLDLDEVRRKYRQSHPRA